MWKSNSYYPNRYSSYSLGKITILNDAKEPHVLATIHGVKGKKFKSIKEAKSWIEANCKIKAIEPEIVRGVVG